MNYETAAALAYPQKSDEKYYYFIEYDYGPMLNCFGKIVVKVDDEDYQGDSRVLYYDAEKGYGYLNFGWGSCSSCDALQACKNLKDIAELMSELHSQIQWRSKEDQLEFFREHDWKGDWSYHQEQQKQFVAQVISYLESADVV